MSTILTDEQRQVVVANVPLVEHIVNRIAASLPATYSRDDLVQTGVLGLISATVRFDPDAGVAFSTYAGRRIEGAVIDLLRRNDWAPRSVRAMERQLNTAEEKLHRSAAPPSTDSEKALADELGCNPIELQKLRQDIAKARVDSIDRPVGAEDGHVPVSESVPDNRVGTEDLLEDVELVGYLRNGVALLPERHRLVITGHFFQGKSITELGDYLGVTQSRTSQIKEEALRLLREGLREAYGEGGPPPEDRPITNRQRSFARAVAESEPLGPRSPAPRSRGPSGQEGGPGPPGSRFARTGYG